MPPFFQKTNKLGVQKNILFVQGGAVTVLSLLFVVMPSVQSFYQILSQLTVILYLVMYLLMFSGAIYLRYNMKKANRPFRIGKKGNGLMWIVGVSVSSVHYWRLSSALSRPARFLQVATRYGSLY